MQICNSSSNMCFLLCIRNTYLGDSYVFLIKKLVYVYSIYVSGVANMDMIVRYTVKYNDIYSQNISIIIMDLVKL